MTLNLPLAGEEAMTLIMMYWFFGFLINFVAGEAFSV